MTNESLPQLLKLNWERRSPPLSISQEVLQRACDRYFSQNVDTIEPFTQGRANANFKVTLSRGEVVVLRIYTREPGALMREYNIHQLIQGKIPVPQFLYINDEKEDIAFPYAFIEYVEGELFRDCILAGHEEAIAVCSHEAGEILTEMMNFEFPISGFFKLNLQVNPFENEETFDELLFSFLKNTKVRDILGKDLVEGLLQIVEKNKEILLDMSCHHTLVHADYDPSNLLIRYENGKGKIAAILDWEFAFSSSPYFDIGLMLRYASRLPPFYQDAFIAGIKERKPDFLSSDWEVKAKLMDCISLLSLSTSEGAEDRPNMLCDIKTILTDSIRVLKS